jgi:hypothetical protein
LLQWMLSLCCSPDHSVSNWKRFYLPLSVISILTNHHFERNYILRLLPCHVRVSIIIPN